MNPNILYLVHSTNHFNSSWKYLRKSDIDHSEHQFPGVYFSLITKHNIHTEGLFPTEDNNVNILIFSKKLLEQENYHINLRDYNGYIHEKNTYYPWELDTVVKKIKNRKLTDWRNIEVIFHNKISLDYLCININIPSKSFNIKNLNFLLPKSEIFNTTEPNKSLKPFYCHTMEFNYTGVDPLKKSSKEFYNKMAILCNIDTNLSQEEIIKAINLQIKDLNKNRDKQKLQEFRKLIEKDTSRNSMSEDSKSS